MKKYIELQSGDITQPGDEWFVGGEWEEIPLPHMNVASITAEVRRPAPYAGDVQFLMCVSILVPVVVECDGKTQEEIEDIAGAMACQKILADPNGYVCHENIDWPACKVDEIQPEPKNLGKYRMLEDGEYLEDGDEEGMKDGTFKPLSPRAIGYVYDIAFGPYRRPITEPQYRPFVEGDVIEGGDQFLHSEDNEWYDSQTYIGYKVELESELYMHRKLVK